MDEPLDKTIINSDDFYSVRKHRTTDLIIGICSGFVYFIFVTLLMVAGGFGYTGLIFSVIYISAIAICFVIKRKYISIGLLIILALPLLIFGGCYLIINGS